MRTPFLLLTTALTLLVACGQTPDRTALSRSTPEAATFHSQSILRLTLAGWGLNTYGQATSPAELRDVTAMAAGRYHSLALKHDGTVVAWGDDSSFGQTAVPAGLNDVKAVAAGTYHSLALKNDGIVVGWGRHDYGQATVPAGLSDVKAVAGGWYHSLALKHDGTVVAWGRNNVGQTTLPGGLNDGHDVQAVVAGTHHNLALKNDGTVVAWGLNTYGQATIPAGLGDVVAIAAGTNHSLALKSDGTVIVWGSDDLGQATLPAGLNAGHDVIAISAGSNHSLALKSDGTIGAWGANNYGQTNIPAGLNDGHNVVTMTAGFYHSLALVAPKDTTPPVITANLTPAIPNGIGNWYISPVTVNWSVQDGESSVTSSSGCDPISVSADTPGTTLTCTATSRGGEGSASFSLKLDTTAPTLAPAMSPTVDGAGALVNPVLLGSSVTVTLNAADSTSGVASTSCTPVDTGTVGTKSVTCTATDNAGNTSQTQVTYTVVYAFQGFEQPVDNLPTINTLKAGSAVPVKFALEGQSNLDVLAAGYPKVTPVSCDATAPTSEVSTTLPATSNSGLTYDAGMYTYVWKTEKAPGCFQLNVRLKDGTDHYALFKLR